MDELDCSGEFKDFKHFKYVDIGSPEFLECARDRGVVFSIFYDGDSAELRDLVELIKKISGED